MAHWTKAGNTLQKYICTKIHSQTINDKKLKDGTLKPNFFTYTKIHKMRVQEQRQSESGIPLGVTD